MIAGVVGLAALVAAPVLLVVLGALLVAGGPWTWLMTALLAAWLGRRAWRWLDTPVTGLPVDARQR